MINKKFDVFKKTGKITDYLEYVKDKNNRNKDMKKGKVDDETPRGDSIKN